MPYPSYQAKGSSWKDLWIDFAHMISVSMTKYGARERTQQLRTFTALAEDLVSVPRAISGGPWLPRTPVDRFFFLGLQLTRKNKPDMET